jgi:hypothetical protein
MQFSVKVSQQNIISTLLIFYVIRSILVFVTTITLNKKIKTYYEEIIMNIKTTVAAVTVLSALSFGAFAAESVNADQAQNLQSVGTISVSGVAGSPMDIRQQLNAKADAQGASAYRVIEANNNGNYHATAELYK